MTPSLGLAAVEARTICTRAEIDIEFVGGDLGQRRDDALADLDLAGRDRHLSVCARIPDHDDSFGFAARLTGSFGAEGAGAGWFIGPPSLPPRAAPPAPCGYANRSGKGCGRALPSPRRLVGTGFRFNSAAALIRMPETQ